MALETLEKHQLQEILVKWAHRFGLWSWDINLQIVPPDNPFLAEEGEDAVPAVVLYEMNQRVAYVYVADPSITEHPSGVEFSIAHELGHLLIDVPLSEQKRHSTELLINEVVKACQRAAGEGIAPAWQVL